MKFKKYALIPIVIILCMIFYAFIAKPIIETRTWVLSYAQQSEPPLFIVAHNDDYDFSDVESSPFQFSKPIEVILEAKDGKLILTDTTNGNTYEGNYKTKSWNRYGHRDINERYTVVIDGIEGTANISSKFGRTLFVSIGDYYLHFEAK